MTSSPPTPITNTPVAWLIRSTDPDPDGETLYWSNADGWVDIDSASLFNGIEATELNLPVAGVWVPFNLSPTPGFDEKTL